MKNYIELETALENISAIKAAPEHQELEADWRAGVDMSEAAIRGVAVINAITVAEAKAMTDKAVNKLKAQLTETAAEVENLNSTITDLTRERDELVAKLDIPRTVENQKPQWKHIEDIRPEESALVLVYGRGTAGVKTAYYSADKEMWKNGRISWWMELPEAPEHN